MTALLMAECRGVPHVFLWTGVSWATHEGRGPSWAPGKCRRKPRSVAEDYGESWRVGEHCGGPEYVGGQGVP